MIFKYSPKGVCSRFFEFDISDKTINRLNVTGGCKGNLQGISSLLVGMNVEDAISKLKNIKCGNKDTSCPDQISLALEEYLTTLK